MLSDKDTSSHEWCGFPRSGLGSLLQWCSLMINVLVNIKVCCLGPCCGSLLEHLWWNNWDRRALGESDLVFQCVLPASSNGSLDYEQDPVNKGMQMTRDSSSVAWRRGKTSINLKKKYPTSQCDVTEGWSKSESLDGAVRQSASDLMYLDKTKWNHPHITSVLL